MEKILPIDEEYLFDDKVIISQTDKDGVITYVNKMFCEVSGYQADELVGQPQSIVRHPDMPKAIFIKLWETIQSGQAWNGLVKNLRQDGYYYWLDTEILPIMDKEYQLTGYISVRKQASKIDIEEATSLYRKMLDLEQ